MNAERLHSIVRAIRDELSTTGSVSIVRQLRDALANSVADPASPQYQQEISALLDRIRDSLQPAPSDQFSPVWKQVVEEIGVNDLLGSTLLSRVNEIFARNQVTTVIAAAEIGELATELEELETGVNHLLAGFEEFRIPADDVPPGAAEIAVLIPRPAVDNELEKFGEELVALKRLLGPFNELASGTRPPMTISTIASSDFSVFVDMTPPAAALVAIAVERVLAGYKTVLEIRTLRQGLKDQGLGDDAVAGVDAHVADIMKGVVAETVQELLRNAAVAPDIGRANELEKELRLALNAIANRIDQGYSIDVRAGEDPDAADSDEPAPDSVALREIRSRSPNLQFINPTGSPILQLPEATSPDGDGAAAETDPPGAD